MRPRRRGACRPPSRATWSTRKRFALGPSSSVTTALRALVDRSTFGRQEDGYSFDSPFLRRWVEREVVEA